MKKFTTEELIIFERLMMENRNSKKLQMITGAGYLESIHIIQKLRKILEREWEK